MIKLYKGLNRGFESRKLNKRSVGTDSLHHHGKPEDFLAACLKLLDGTTPGTAIYILSCLCPENMDVILNLTHLDLSQPHHHALPSKKRVRLSSSSYDDAISHLRAYGSRLSEKDYGRLWLEAAHQWLLTCPLTEEYYQPDEGDEDTFCRRLRSELLDRIMRFD